MFLSENIRFSLKPFKIQDIRSMFLDNKLTINPTYQRSHVWTVKQKARLIESISINFPVGILVMIDRRNKLEVIDGQQRVYAISEFASSELENTDGERFDELESAEQRQFLQYVIPCIVLDPGLSQDQISSIFVRLQEGTPLSTGEKVYALVGKFRNTFVDAYLDDKNKKFFSNINDRRFKARLLAAHFLAIELGTNFENNTFPDISYDDLIKLNEVDYKKTPLPPKIVSVYNENIRFIGKYLGGTLIGLRVREITPLYLLVSYMRWNKTLDSKRGNKLNDFIQDLRQDLDKFSIYAERPPKGMDPKVFGSLMKYKTYSRQALTGESLRERLEVMKDEFKDRAHLKA